MFDRGTSAVPPTIALCGLILASCLGGEPARPPDSAAGPDSLVWEPLFNGRDLEGWTVKIAGYPVGTNYANTFRVVDGVMKASYDRYDGDFASRFGHIFFDRPFSHYIVAVEYRFVGEQARGAPDWALRNSGVMVHSQSAASMGIDQDFPISIEVQLLGGTGTGERTTANLCTPGTHVEMVDKLIEEHCINSTSKTYHGDQWVRTETLVLADSLIRHMVEGHTVLEYSAPQVGGGVVNGFDPEVKHDGERLTGGYIALQSEGHPIEFRKIELLNLKGCGDRRALNYKAYVVEPDPSVCEYPADAPVN